MGSLLALASAGGSPGATTAALALALCWPAPVMVAECDPAGGSVLAGTMGGHVSSLGLMEHAIEAGRDEAAATAGLLGKVVALDGPRTRTVLPGLTDPRQAAGLAPAWPAVAATLTAQPVDVIADCGRLDAGQGQPFAVLAAASMVVLVLRPTLRQVWAARPRLDMLGQLLGGTSRLVLLVTGPGEQSAREIAGILGVPVIAVLPADARSAAVLSDGAHRPHRLGSGELMTAATAAAHALRRRVSVQASIPAGASISAFGAVAPGTTVSGDGA